MTGSTAKQAEVFVETVLPFLGVSLLSFPSFEESLGVDIFLGSTDLPLFCEEPEDKLLLFFCLDYEGPLPLSEANLLLLFFSDLLPEEFATGV